MTSQEWRPEDNAKIPSKCKVNKPNYLPSPKKSVRETNVNQKFSTQLKVKVKITLVPDYIMFLYACETLYFLFLQSKVSSFNSQYPSRSKSNSL